MFGAADEELVEEAVTETDSHVSLVVMLNKKPERCSPMRRRETHANVESRNSHQLQNVSGATILIETLSSTSRLKRIGLSVLTLCHYKSNCTEHRFPTVKCQGQIQSQRDEPT